MIATAASLRIQLSQLPTLGSSAAGCSAAGCSAAGCSVAGCSVAAGCSSVVGTSGLASSDMMD